MTELKKKAYDYACINVPIDERSHDTYFRNIQTAYIDGATEIMNEMKCCQNCKYLESRCVKGIDGCFVCSKLAIFQCYCVSILVVGFIGLVVNVAVR